MTTQTASAMDSQAQVTSPHSPRWERIARALAAAGAAGRTVDELAADIGAPRNALYLVMQTLRKKGLVTRTGTRPQTYYVADPAVTPAVPTTPKVRKARAPKAVSTASDDVSKDKTVTRLRWISTTFKTLAEQVASGDVSPEQAADIAKSEIKGGMKALQAA